jgi:hypothetical protein
VWLVRAFVVSIYFWGAVAKTNARWLSGRTLASLRDEGLLEGPIARLAFGTAEATRASAVATVVAEFGLVALLLHPRTRKLGFVIACLMHASFEVTVRPDVFGVLMIVLLSTFWSVSERGRSGSGQTRDLSGTSSPGRSRTAP